MLLSKEQVNAVVRHAADDIAKKERKRRFKLVLAVNFLIGWGIAIIVSSIN